jgi:hypothetical protein
MKIEELPHISIERIIPTKEKVEDCWYYSEGKKDLFRKNGYIPQIDCMADSYGIISKVLDKDCVVAYITDNSQTTFLIKTSRQYVGFITLSEKLTKYLSTHSTRRLTRLNHWRDDDDGFMRVTKDDDLVIVDEDKWDKYLKTKILEGLGNE